MQGAGGISAPVSVTFLNAIRLDRAAFIATISVFLMIMSVVQIPLLASFGILTPHRAALSLAAMVPLFLAMPVGARLTRHVSKATFDRMILVLLTVIALKLVWDARAGAGGGGRCPPPRVPRAPPGVFLPRRSAHRSRTDVIPTLDRRDTDAGFRGISGR
jgi:hypothetical protein